MANLRGLLGKEFKSTVASTFAEVGSLEKMNDGRTYVFHPGCNLDNCDETGYRDRCIQFFCMPCGTTSATFELWGGGGSGAGGCCCQQGVPGGSGAYVRKTLQYPLVQGSWCYALCVAGPTCCSACCIGIQGCKSVIVGCNLTNLCADGGVPGKSCCYAYWGADFRCLDRVYWEGCGGYSPTDSTAAAYGGDCMIPGRPGFFRTHNTANNCYTKVGLSYPPKIIDDLGGHLMSNVSGNACSNQRTYCQGTTPWAFNANCRNTLPGVGSPSTTSCGGSCCYGLRGGGGLIKVTLCSCWIGNNCDCSFVYIN